ncbi:LysM peptidoglycan-binding domain-containing protein [Bifidobacterium sp. ESL0763]|uniref:LysM peptidoglycan-binding domain-containing protein n=1 Tax=Bifidobacterium sp. ESL0763 TaxID=2983227 RepID=UPI0023F77138|nr:LysM peptidoglycan-binding domain-containing protein [Bifidobacterium sp. ESL0763]MDF7664160.1 LysM peptidoglycan-binding domain-containing protein [Bifidobacterium sp. ESL0763]
MMAVRRSHVRSRRRGPEGKTLLKAAVALLAALVMWCGWQSAQPNDVASDLDGTPVVSYTVKPGDTLWSYAQSITPEGQSVSKTVNMLMGLNNMASTQIVAGQTIVVPEQVPSAA